MPPTTSSRLCETGPLVSLLIATHDRPGLLSQSLASALAQTYRNLEVFVIRDGGLPVRSVVESFDDPRIRFIDRDENRGLAASYNQALGEAKGKYVAYLGDDDVHYPQHVERLVHALETDTDCLAAYSDLYATAFVPGADGRRIVMAKHANSRQYNRLFMMNFNQVLGGSMLHRRDLLDRTGLYNENLQVMIDWDITRRMAFYTDFHHVQEITGEYYMDLDKARSDRISDRLRRDQKQYKANCLAIRTTRPAKPWPTLADLSIILLADRLDDTTRQRIADASAVTFTPYQVILPLDAEERSKLDRCPKTVEAVTVPPDASPTERIRAALDRCEGDAIAIAPPDLPVEPRWVEDALHTLLQCDRPDQAVSLDGRQRDDVPAAVFRPGHLRSLLDDRSGLPLATVLQGRGDLREPADAGDLPLALDDRLVEARSLVKARRFHEAADVYLQPTPCPGDELWVWAKGAWALYHDGGDDGRALDVCRHINHRWPTVNTLLLEGKLLRRRGDNQAALSVLVEANRILTV